MIIVSHIVTQRDRPKVGALDAVDKLTVKLQFGRYHFVVEADIRGFFDNLQHDWLVRMLEERIEDGAFLRLIQKWLSAGVLDTDGQVLHPATGTPQGGIVSPVLANVYLHYALDLWFHKVVKPQCQGEACLIRYADDFVAAFQYQADAERFYQELSPRLAKFGLELSAEKTRVLTFSAQHDLGKTSFDFLGFEFRWGRDRKGTPRVQRRTARKKFRNSLKQFTAWCQVKSRGRMTDLFKELNAKLRGYYNYFGVLGNSVSLKQFFYQVQRILFKWLNRRSHKESYTWTGFQELLRDFQIEQPHLVARPKTSKMRVGARA